MVLHSGLAFSSVPPRLGGERIFSAILRASDDAADRGIRYLATHPNSVIAHRELLQAVWGPDYGNEVEYLRVFVNQLRKKLEPQPAKPRYLLTEPGSATAPACRTEINGILTLSL